MELFNGREHAKLLDNKIKEHLKTHNAKGNLAIIQIGDNEESTKYVSLKKKIASNLGLTVSVHLLRLGEGGNSELITRGLEIINDEKNTGVIVQLPLPSEDFDQLLDKIPYEKDIDLLSSVARGKFYAGGISRLSPVVRGVEYFMESTKLNIKDKNVLVVGQGNLVGKPVSFYLKIKGANVQVTENYSPKLAKDKDLIVLSAGVPNLVKGSDIPRGCSVIDFGSTVVNGKIIGDLDFSSDTSHLGIISKSPGGMGPLIVRFLFMNHLGI